MRVSSCFSLLVACAACKSDAARLKFSADEDRDTAAQGGAPPAVVPLLSIPEAPGAPSQETVFSKTTESKEGSLSGPGKLRWWQRPSRWSLFRARHRTPRRVGADAGNVDESADRKTMHDVPRPPTESEGTVAVAEQLAALRSSPGVVLGSKDDSFVPPKSTEPSEPSSSPYAGLRWWWRPARWLRLHTPFLFPRRRMNQTGATQEVRSRESTRIRLLEQFNSSLRRFYSTRILPALRRWMGQQVPFHVGGFRPDLELGQGSVSVFAWALQRQQLQQVGRPLKEKARAIADYILRPSKKIVFTLGGRQNRNITLTPNAFLGSGGFGTVYSVDQENGEQLAIKVVTTSIEGLELEKLDEQLRLDVALLKRETNMLRFFKNEKAVDVYKRHRLVLPLAILRLPVQREFIVLEKNLLVHNMFFLLPLAAGTVEEIVALFDDSPTGSVARMSVTAQMVKVVAGLHKRGLVHGDLKPPNFLVTKEGIVLLTDFTYLYVAGRSTAVPVFTSAFASPEMIRTIEADAEMQCHPSMDSWMLGMAVYYVWCKKYPWGITIDEVTLFDVKRKIRAGKDRVLDFSGCGGIPASAQKTITMFLKDNAEHRWLPQDALEMLPSFNEYIRDVSATASEDFAAGKTSPQKHARKPARTESTRVGSGVTGSL